MDVKDGLVRNRLGKKSELIETGRLNEMEVMNETTVDRMAEFVTGWVQEVNDNFNFMTNQHMRECERWCGRRIVWWTRKLSALKSNVRKKRRL